MAKNDTPPNADFVGRVVSDAKTPPETRMLTGWLGDAAEEGYRRLYTNADLSAYVDIPADAILYSEPIRDVQPAGGVFVWVQRDAELKPGGSAASRAARFLQGQVQQDFSSPEKAGFRCITQVPCGEPTGFTGQCTKQPDVGGAWPCITALPLCAAEPTGFTGKCTYQPWPNPTRYIGCTILHCPTQDLTHIPHICNIVATGLPGCPAVNLPGGEQEQPGVVAEGAEGGGAARAAAPATAIPGCGYTQTWGLCETHLLGCGFTKQWGACQQTQPPKCLVSVDIPCITQDAACGATRNPACFAEAGALRAAAPGPVIPDTQAPCSAVDTCPTRFGCETQPPTAFCTQLPEACQPPATSCGPQCQTQQQSCTQIACTQAGPQCPTFPNGDCTFFGCPTVLCEQRAAPQVAAAAPTPATRCFICPPTPATICTLGGPLCPPTTHPSGCPPSANPQCQTPACFQGMAPEAAAAPQAGGGAQIAPTVLWQCSPTPATRCFICPPLTWTPGQCPTPPQAAPTPATVCTQFGAQCRSAVDACPTRFCGGGGFRAAGPQEPTPATVCFICTQIPRYCPIGQ